jgi:pimeloyl-ACP methyl ester carboxylesterase
MPSTGFPQLGEYKEARVSAGRIGYHDVGEGPTLLFIHGLLVNSALWSKLIPLLSDRYRCIAPDLPLGSHSIPLDSNAGLDPYRGADLIGEFIRELGLERPTLVGNDTGGALCQMLVVRQPGIAERLILTNCDAYDKFPPQPFTYLLHVPKIPGAMTLLTQSMRPHFARRLPIAYGWLAKRMPRDVEDAFVGPVLSDKRVRQDAAAFLKAAKKSYMVDTSARYGEIDIPVVIAWGEDDKSFKVDMGERMARDIPGAKLVRVPDSYTFVSLDQPERLAEIIAEAVPA